MKSNNCPICGGNSNLFRELKGEGKVYQYYICSGCSSIFIDPLVIERMDQGDILIPYNEEYWEMEKHAAIERCYGVCIARMAEVFYYSTIPIKAFLDAGGGTGMFLDAVTKYLPSSKNIFHSVEKYPPKLEDRTKSENYFTCDYNKLGKIFDAGICIEVVEHLTPKMILNFFEDIAKVSRTGAVYLINSGFSEFTLKEDENYLDPFIRGHIISYSIEGLANLLKKIGFYVKPIKGKTWACVAIFGEDIKEDITDRIWNALPENIATLCDDKMGNVLKILGLESVRAYF